MITESHNPLKIIFFPNVNGEFIKFVEILNRIQEKSGKFDLIILTENVFNPTKDFGLVKELEKINSKILIFDQSEVGVVFKHKLDTETHNLLDNVIVLGRSGYYFFEGLRIAYLNGKENKKFLSEEEKFKYTSCFFSRDDFDRVVNDSNKFEMKTDILLINSLPSIIYDEMLNNFNSPLNSKTLELDKIKIKERVSLSLNLLIKKVMPRYIFTSVGDFYYERTPILNAQKYFTRLINIAYFPSEYKKNLKEKFIFALSLKPVNTMLNSELHDIGNTEYTRDIFKDVSDDFYSLFINKSKFGDKNLIVSKEELYIGNLDKNITYDELLDFMKRFGELEYLNMICDKRNRFLGHAFVKFKNLSLHEQIIKKSNEFSLKGRKVIIGEKVEKQISIEEIEKKCWFCFKNPEIDTDLILKEFNEFYLAYPKGPIDDFHFMLLPKNHIKSFIDLNENQKKEFVNILDILSQLINDNNLDYLIYEKNLPYKDEAAKHMIINIVGIGKEYSFSFLDQMYLVMEQNKLNFREFDSKMSISQLVKRNENYYFIDAPTGIQFGKSAVRTKVIINVNEHTKDYADYPRKIICNLLEKEERMNWKKTEVNKEFLVQLKDKLIKYYK